MQKHTRKAGARDISKMMKKRKRPRKLGAQGKNKMKMKIKSEMIIAVIYEKIEITD